MISLNIQSVLRKLSLKKLMLAKMINLLCIRITFHAMSFEESLFFERGEAHVNLLPTWIFSPITRESNRIHNR